jgi:hypothetical protein
MRRPSQPAAERALFKTTPSAPPVATTPKSASPSDEYTVWAPNKVQAAAAALAKEATRPTPQGFAAEAAQAGHTRHQTQETPAPAMEATPLERHEPTTQRDHPGDGPEHTVFAPARAAAALTAPVAPTSGRSEPPVGAHPVAVTEPSEDALREMRDRFSLGDYTGALVLAEGFLDHMPNNAEVNDCADQCRAVLRQMYTARIGPLDRVPVVTVARDQLRWLSIDHRAGFVLSHIDGISSLEMILDVSGMPVLDALRILCELAQQRIISFR